MFEVLAQSHDQLIGIRVTGTLSDDDYKSVLIPTLEAALAKGGKLRVLLLFEDFEGWDLHAAWDDAVFGMEHRGDFERLALVGAPSYVEIGMRLFAPLMSGSVRSFTAESEQAAWAWLEAAT